MSGEHPEIEEAELLLARTAKMDFVFAQHVQQRALDSDDPAELAELARAYARLTRSVRQNLALLNRQKADREKAAREARREAEAPTAPSVSDIRRQSHMDDIQAGVSRVIVAEAEGDRRRIREHLERFDREMDDWHEKPDFEDYEPDEIIRHACRVLDLPENLADRWRTLPDPTWLPDPAPQVEAAQRDPDRQIHWPPGDFDDDDDIEDDLAAPPTAATDSS
ncbi:MAG: hypothetical protein U1C74_06410 [Phenylobacterium sp.]|nr:hypothetical protein [Phenylobacterium sp.]